MDFANPELEVTRDTVGLETVLDRTDNEVGSSFLEEGHPFFGLETESISYAPSMVQTNFSECLPLSSGTDDAQLVDGYNAEAVVGAAWTSLKAVEPKLPWESDFWEQFFDPKVSAFDQLTKGFKRPQVFHHASSSSDAAEQEVDRRVFAKTFPEVKSFLKIVRDIPEKSWQEERDALWETAIRRWVAILDSWTADGILLVQALQGKESFTEKAQILVDVFFNKAPQTLMKRVNSMSKVCGQLASQGIGFPCTETEFYEFLKEEARKGAPASRLKAFFEAVVFSRHTLGVGALQALIDSRRCLGAASQTKLGCPRQASPFTVAQLRKLHAVLREGSEPWDQAMAGMLLFCVYSRSRWSDAQHAEELKPDFDDAGKLQYLEVRTAVHKTARAFHLRHMFLPLSAPASGVTEDQWAEQWLQVRRCLQIEDLKKFPLMPAPDSNLEPTKRPISTAETKQWILHLLGNELVGMSKLSSHSCKCTCLSYLAKRGASYEDRLVLGYHSNKMKMALVYSRDSISRPLALLAHVLMEIRTGIFEPDNTRSGRLRAEAVALDKAHFFADRAGQQVNQPEPGPELNNDSDVAETELGSWQKISVDMSSVPEEQIVEDHVTTDSSDSSGPEGEWAPVVGHYTIELPSDKKLWLNKNSKMFHLSHLEYSRVLLCGRRVGQSFVQHSGHVRYDSAKCRQCFRLKDS